LKQGVSLENHLFYRVNLLCTLCKSPQRNASFRFQTGGFGSTGTNSYAGQYAAYQSRSTQVSVTPGVMAFRVPSAPLVLTVAKLAYRRANERPVSSDVGLFAFYGQFWQPGFRPDLPRNSRMSLRVRVIGCCERSIGRNPCHVRRYFGRRSQRWPRSPSWRGDCPARRTQ
jgi:hypothetical protein